MELLELACGMPMIFEQMYYDLDTVLERQKQEQAPDWKKAGETAAEARDRLRAERDAAKKRLQSGSV